MNTYSYIVNGLVGYAWPLGFDSIVDRSSIKCQMFIPFLDSHACDIFEVTGYYL